MRNIKEIRFLIILVLSSILFIVSPVLNAQKPPRPITVSTVSDLAFGTFWQGASGGSVIVSTSNSRSPTGDVVLLGGTGAVSAVFSVNGDLGTLVTITYGTSTLTRGGGGSMSLSIGPTNPASYFVLPGTAPVSVTAGGTLTVGPPSSNPPGSYSGSFTVTFNQN